ETGACTERSAGELKVWAGAAYPSCGSEGGAASSFWAYALVLPTFGKEVPRENCEFPHGDSDDPCPRCARVRDGNVRSGTGLPPPTHAASHQQTEPSSLAS